MAPNLKAVRAALRTSAERQGWAERALVAQPYQFNGSPSVLYGFNTPDVGPIGVFMRGDPATGFVRPGAGRTIDWMPLERYGTDDQFATTGASRLANASSGRSLYTRINAALDKDAGSQQPLAYKITNHLDPTEPAGHNSRHAIAKIMLSQRIREGDFPYTIDAVDDTGELFLDRVGKRQPIAPLKSALKQADAVDVVRQLLRNKPALSAVPATAALGAGALAMRPGEAQAQTLQPPQPSALARALAREAPRFNAALDTSLDVASFFDPTGGYATETARALKDLPAKVGPAGTVALAPLTGATEALAGIGQLPELGVAGGRAIARALARKPQPRGSQTYRKRK